VFDQGEYRERPFIVTEFIQGRTLEHYYQDVRPSIEQSIKIVWQLADALEFAHRLGIYHQDIKPSNILIDDLNRLKLIDFGIAWFRPAWRSGSDPLGCIGGTPSYLSPEQANGGTITARTDIFAMGAVLFFLLTGHSLYPDTLDRNVVSRAKACRWDASRLNRPEIPSTLRAVCRKALSADPQDRHSSALELANDAAKAIRIPWNQSSRGIVKMALMVALFMTAIAGGRGLQNWFSHAAAPVVMEKTNLVVRVARKRFNPESLGDVVPLKDGDSLEWREYLARFETRRAVADPGQAGMEPWRNPKADL
jgi:serine/threonine protein kinase